MIFVVGPIYGELTYGSMTKIIRVLVEDCDFNSRSKIADIGSGLGKPIFHIANVCQPMLAVGVEVEELRWKLSMHNLKCVYEQSLSEDSTLRCNGVWFIHSDISLAATFDPFTHLYAFDIGMPEDLFKKMANMFNSRCENR